MKIRTTREQLLNVVQSVIGVVERRQTMPMLANIYLSADEQSVTCIATDRQVELSIKEASVIDQPGETTVPGRKFYDVIRALPEAAEIEFSATASRAEVLSGRSRFRLASLPADQFPIVEAFEPESVLLIQESELKKLLDMTAFSMAQQDVRYYLNGLCLEPYLGVLRAIATDGHRLALAEVVTEDCPENDAELPARGEANDLAVIVPRKGVQELSRLLADASPERYAKLSFNRNFIEVELGNTRFRSLLVDGRYPNYKRAIPDHREHIARTDRLELRAALARAAVLSDPGRGVGLRLSDHLVRIQARSADHDEVDDEIAIDFNGPELEIGFNVGYLLDALGALRGDEVRLFFGEPDASCVIRELEDNPTLYVVSPIQM